MSLKIWIICVVILIIIVVCVIESVWYTTKKEKYEVLKPRSWNTFKVNYKGKDYKCVVYSVKHKDELLDEFKKLKYKIKPKILFANRIKKPFTKVAEGLKDAKEGDLIVTNLIDSTLPIVGFSSDVIMNESKYRILSDIPGLKATINGDKIDIRLPKEGADDDD